MTNSLACLKTISKHAFEEQATARRRSDQLWELVAFSASISENVWRAILRKSCTTPPSRIPLYRNFWLGCPRDVAELHFSGSQGTNKHTISFFHYIHTSAPVNIFHAMCPSCICMRGWPRGGLVRLRFGCGTAQAAPVTEFLRTSRSRWRRFQTQIPEKRGETFQF